MSKGKNTKKKNFKLRRQLRKTLGCLFMISALVVTAIPVQPTEAAADGWTTGSAGYPFVTSESAVIPEIRPDTPIYQTEDGNFRFAYVDKNGNYDAGSDQNKSAVIVGYEKTQTLNQGKLVIPDKVDAYVKYTDTQGTYGGYAAANKKGRPLYYKHSEVRSTTRSGDPVLVPEDLNGDGLFNDYEIPAVTEEAPYFQTFLPCTADSKDTWGAIGRELFFYDNASKNYTADPGALTNAKDPAWTEVELAEDDRIQDVTVQYIGNQYATYNTTEQKWKVEAGNVSSAAESVFGGSGEGKAAANIVNLTIGPNLNGIGNYAFYGCTNLSVFTPGNGLAILGNYAFAECVNLNKVNMDYYTNLNTLGDHAFSNCRSLQTFDLPTATQAIGDFCFENCTSLKEINMGGVGTGGELNHTLNKIGYKAFLNCTSLESLTLPDSYHGANHKGQRVFHLSTVMGCTSLKKITTSSEMLDFVTDADSDQLGKTGTTQGEVDGQYGFDAFKADVGSGFYFEAPGYVSGSNNTQKTPAHNTANVKHVAFKYLGEERYEIVEPGKNDSGDAVGLVYVVNDNGDLIEFRVEDAAGNRINPKVPEIVMPEKIGPYDIKSIVQGSFNDNCSIQKVTLPSSLVRIGANAFKGSHNLRHVIFSNASGLLEIGTDAFATQVVSELHKDGGAEGDACRDEGFLNEAPFLSFTGDIEKADGTNTEPFKFAMMASSRINAGEQPITYITYYSGMPTNLTVKYNPDTQMSELQDFATKAEVTGGFAAEAGSSDKYKYPYITDSIAAEAAGSFGTGTLTENQLNIKNGVENIVIPRGVNSIKEGLFSGLAKDGRVLGTGQKADETYLSEAAPDVKSVTTKSIVTIEPYTFARMPELTAAYISGATTVGDYAFDGCPELAAAEIGPETTTLGLRPFSGCEKIANVSFPNSQSFTCADGIIYGISGDGARTKIVECLESRGVLVGSRAVGPDELEGVTEIAKEAFMDCDRVTKVDLSKSGIVTIPIKCFAEMDRLFDVVLPETARIIDRGSFWNTTSLGFVTIPNSVGNIAPDAFGYTSDEGETFDNAARKIDSFEFVCLPDSNAADYATLYDYIGTTTSADMKVRWSVMLFDAVDESNPVLIEERRIMDGENIELTAEDAPNHEKDGYVFVRWQPSPDIYNPIVDNTEIWALYEPMGAKTYRVRFFDINKAEMREYTQQVAEGRSAIAPSKDVMEIEGKVFTGWDRDYTNITNDIDIYAQYSDRVPGTYVVNFWADTEMTQMVGRTQIVKEGESAIEPAHPKKDGYTFTGWYPATSWQNVTKDLDVVAMYAPGGGSSDNGNNDNNGNNNNGNNNNNGGGNGSGTSNSDSSVSGNSQKYKAVINGGSGSGEYTAGTVVSINAYAASDGTVFSNWSSSSKGVGFANQSAVSTTFTMPANDVEITANYKTGYSVSGNYRNTRRNTATTVDISKPGISNTGLASANVNGSSDNYIVKITEDPQATAAVIAALEAKYGDLSNIAYLPMDISLYDSTGQTKITDVSGITVDITLPLPDALIQYAGNNRAASVVNGQLEELGTRFTTIDGVPCIQFTATHFSPYTIYVDKGNLTEGLMDATPKTGDPIHPKWFLSMGLACISIVLFCKKDKMQKNLKVA